jgi:hypothetical protein
MPDMGRFIASGFDGPKSGIRESAWSGVSSQNPSILPIIGSIPLRVDSWRSAREFMGNCYYFRRIRCSYTAQNYSIGEADDKPERFAARWNKRSSSLSPGIAVTPPASDRSQYVSFPAYSNAIRKGFYYGTE